MKLVQKKSPELIANTLAHIASGKTLADACRLYDFSNDAWAKWLKQDPELSQAYAEARIIGADAMADDILNIVDTVSSDHVEISKARLRSEMRLKLLAKWQPSKYGDSVALKHQGEDGGPVQVAYANVGELARQMREAMAGKAPAALPDQTGDDLL